ncbi:MAG: heme o synthase [SAR86 cluster bacterium]|nr:heme o synthase [Gammaproteobacteria bacterium]MDG2456777.1 heme o synthase [SAR86 cluster bacterium]
MNQTTTSSWRGYLELTKPGVQALLFVSCISGMLIGSKFSPPLSIFIFGLLGISFLAASAAVINHIFDSEIDGKMNRTASRPLVKGSITEFSASVFAAALYVSGSLMLLIYVNALTWILTSLTFIFYAFIYTRYLKFMTSQNIVIGGLAGAMPPLLGWTAVSNTIEPNAWLLVLIVMVWTPPHFWALAVYRVDDYAEAAVPMLPVQKGIAFTKQHIVLYTLLLLASTMLPYAVGMFQELYLVVALILGLGFLYFSIKLYRDDTNASAMQTFAYSISYLAALFGAMLVDQYLYL